MTMKGPEMADEPETTSDPTAPPDNGGAAKLAEATASIARLEAKNQEINAKNKRFGEALKVWEGFEPADAVKLKDLLDAADKADDDKSRDKGEIDVLLDRATKRIRDMLEPKLEEATKRGDEAVAEVTSLRREREFDLAARRIGIDPDLRDAFDLTMGKLARWHADGDEPERLVVLEDDVAIDFHRWIDEMFIVTPAAKKMMLVAPLPGGAGSRQSTGNGALTLTPERLGAMNQRDYEKARTGEQRR